jgi:hypothetical protein
MRRITGLLAAAVAIASTSTWAAESRPSPACDRACLYGVLDQYLSALRARDATKAPWAARVVNTENNVELMPGDGLWGTLSSLDSSYEMRFADVAGGQVAVFGVVDESGTRAPYSLRLKVVERVVTEVETLIARPQEAGVPFVNADIKPLPIWSEMLAPAQRVPRQKMIDVANGYFDTLQLNDGKLYTSLAAECNRRENGTQTTNNTGPGANPIWKYGCEQQFRLGAYRYDDRLRGRRFEVVDEERGIVLAGGFIDHSGRIKEFPLTDGTTRKSNYLRPHTFSLFEAFKIVDGKIRQVEAVFYTLPYNSPSPWDRALRNSSGPMP